MVDQDTAHADLPLTPETAKVLRQLIGKRKFGFVFMNEEFVSGDAAPARAFADNRTLRLHLKSIREAVLGEEPGARRSAIASEP